MKTTILQALRVLLVLTVITGVAYPLIMTVIASAAFHDQANGSMVLHKGQLVGSSLIGQQFTRPEYFHSRPSVIGYNPLPSSGSNLGPTSKALHDSVAVYRHHFISDNNLSHTASLPKEMLSASGSGLDPHISPEAAMMQVDRIARARAFNKQTKAALMALVTRSTEAPEFGLFGQPRVNVLLLNIALDNLSSQQ